MKRYDKTKTIKRKGKVTNKNKKQKHEKEQTYDKVDYYLKFQDSESKKTYFITTPLIDNNYHSKNEQKMET